MNTKRQGILLFGYSEEVTRIRRATQSILDKMIQNDPANAHLTAAIQALQEGADKLAIVSRRLKERDNGRPQAVPNHR